MVKDKAKPQIFQSIFIGVVLILVYIPIISLVVFSFNDSESVTRWQGFTFKWYTTLFTSPEIIEAVLVTIIVAIISTLISTIVGTLAAISLTKVRKSLREAVFTANNLPVVNPEIVTAIAMFLLFGALSIPRGYATMLIAHVAFSVPYVLITVYPKVKGLDPNLIDAAYDLGATPIKALFSVILPQIKFAVIAGAAIAFTMSFDDFIISYFAVNGTAIKNISIYLYMQRRIRPTVNALSTIIIFFIGIKVLIDYLRNRKKKEEE